MKYQLINKNYNNENCDLILYELLKDRGIENPEMWLNPNSSYEHSPSTLDNLSKAVSLLKKAINNPESVISIVVDSDVDGYTSGAIIASLLKKINRGQEIHCLLHSGKEHGIEIEEIPSESNLVIIPDASSSQKEEHMKLLQNGIDIIILDHHEMDNDLNYGDYSNNIALVNSQQESYPNHGLSGAGVALKFVQQYCMTYNIMFPNILYGLASCGIVADVMDLSDLENKEIVTNGLKYIKENNFLYQLIKDAHYNTKDPKPSIKDIGWVIGPNINAIIRLGSQEQKRLIFNALVNPNLLVYSNKRGEENVEVPIYLEASRECKNAKKRQTSAVDKSIKIIMENEDDLLNDNSIIYIDKDKKLTFELSGLIANKLLSKYNKPVILLRPFIQNNIDEYRGSVRGKQADGLTNLKALMCDITGVEKAEGHAFAFGLNIDKGMEKEFKMHLNSILQKFNFNENIYNVDLVSKASNLNIEVAKIISRDDIWCHGVEKPLAAITDIPSDDFNIMGNDQQHLKINCGNFDVVLFGVPDLTKRLLNKEKFNLDIIGEFSVDLDYEVGRLQIIAKDYKINPYKEKTIWDMAF